MKKTSILPKAIACLSEAICILLHLTYLEQSHPKSISVLCSSLKRGLSFSLQVLASMHCNVGTLFEDFSLLPSISWIHIHFISVPSQATVYLQACSLCRCQSQVTGRWRCSLAPSRWICELVKRSDC